MKTIFLSYRREDRADAVDRIYHRLADHFGKAAVFRDLDDIPKGVKFANVISVVLKEVVVVLVAIGPDWLFVLDEEGKRRLDNPDDWVRLEVRTALDRNIIVMPMLIGGLAQPPRSHELPEDLRCLLDYNAIFIRRDPDFEGDIDCLLKSLSEPRPMPTELVAGDSGPEPKIEEIPEGKATGNIQPDWNNQLQTLSDFGPVVNESDRAGTPPETGKINQSEKTTEAGHGDHSTQSRQPNQSKKATARPPRTTLLPVAFSANFAAKNIAGGAATGWGIITCTIVMSQLFEGSGIGLYKVFALFTYALVGSGIGGVSGYALGWITALAVKSIKPSLVAGELRRLGFGWALSFGVGAGVCGGVASLVFFPYLNKVTSGLPAGETLEDAIAAFAHATFLAMIVLSGIVIFIGIGAVLGGGFFSRYLARKLRLSMGIPSALKPRDNWKEPPPPHVTTTRWVAFLWLLVGLLVGSVLIWVLSSIDLLVRSD